MVGNAVDQRLLGRVLEAAVAWSSRTPWVEVLPWPGGASFAGVVERDTSGSASDGRAGEAWSREIEAAERDAGTARLLVSTEARRDDATEARLAGAIGELRRRGAWLATRREISAWTRQRAPVQASVRRAGPRRIVVAVTNFGRAAASRVVLRVFLNEPVLRAEVDTTKLLQSAARVQMHPGAEALDLILPVLDPRASAAFTLDYEPASSQDG